MNRVVITGGGTGGHLKIAQLFMKELHSRGVELIYIGSRYGQDQKWFLNEEMFINKIFLNTQGVVNKGFVGKIKSLLQIVKLALFCKAIFKENSVNKVVSVGGYSAASASFAAILSKDCQLYIHEQNAYMGKLNQITSRFTTKLFSSYDSRSPIKGYPIDDKFFELQRVRKDVKKIIFLGGSQGAKAINDFALSIAQKLDSMGISIIHQAGKKDFKRVQEAYNTLGIKADVFDFCVHIEKKMSEADFAISRSGASTLWELCANGIPTLFVPYPYAASNHQYFNAKELLDKNLAFLSVENELNFEYLQNCLQSDIQTISSELIKNVQQNAIKDIVDEILK